MGVCQGVSTEPSIKRFGMEKEQRMERFGSIAESGDIDKPRPLFCSCAGQVPRRDRRPRRRSTPRPLSVSYARTERHGAMDSAKTPVHHRPSSVLRLGPGTTTRSTARRKYTTGFFLSLTPGPAPRRVRQRQGWGISSRQLCGTWTAPQQQRTSGTCAKERNARRASAVPGGDTPPLALRATDASSLKTRATATGS